MRLGLVLGVLLVAGGASAGVSSNRLRRKDRPFLVDDENWIRQQAPESLGADESRGADEIEALLVVTRELERQLEDFPMSMSMATESPTASPVAVPSTSIPASPLPTPLASTPTPASSTPTAAPAVNPVPDTPSPTMAPVVIPTPSPIPDTPSPTGAPRDDVILEKCGVSGLERSRDILSELTSISDSSALLTPSTAQFKARNWLDNRDGAVVCADEPEHIRQRYMVAVLYYGMGGGSWSNCAALEDVAEDGGCTYQDVRSSRRLNQLIEDSNGNYESVTSYKRKMEANWTEAGAIRWLSEENECEWFGLDCGGEYLKASGAFAPLVNIDVSDNNLMGSFLPEMVIFSSLQGYFVDGNGNISGSIPSEIGAMTQLKFLDFDGNSLSGPIPDSLFSLSNLVNIDLNSNMLTGSLSEAVGDLSDLEVLQLENNSLAGGLPTEALLNLLQLGTLCLKFWEILFFVDWSYLVSFCYLFSLFQSP